MRPLCRLLSLLLPLLFATPARAGDDPSRVAAAMARARDIANRLQAALDPDQKGRVTMAVGVLDNGKVIIATSEDRNTLRSPLDDIRRAEDADLVDSSPPAHAERKIIDHVRSSLFFYRNRRILAIAAGRPICEGCEQAIVAAGARPASPCKSGQRY